jgi:hypothetical protein
VKPCYHNLGPATCPAWPWCGCDDEHEAAKPLPDPEQLDIYDVLGEDE